MIPWLDACVRSLRAGLARLRGLFSHAAADRDLLDELESHFRLQVDDSVRAGLPRDEAVRRARIALGGVEQMREIHRDQRGVPVFENFLRDLRYGVAGLRKNPTFAVAAILILGLGIGVNTAIFTVVNAVVLRPLPFPDPDRIMRIWHTPPASFVGQKTFALSPANFIDWRAQSRSFEHLAIYRFNRPVLTGAQDPEAVIAGRASAALFPMFGLKPILGRLLTDAEDGAGGPAVAVLSEKMWRTRFGADPGIVGRNLILDGETVSVIGVVEQPTAVFDRAQLWRPLAWSAAERAVRANHNYQAVAKLLDGVTVQQAQADLTAISRRLEREYPADNKNWGAVVLPLQDDIVGNARASLLLLLGAVGLVLLIACANLANLLLVRTHARAKEIAVRTALGAGRARVMVQLLTEGLVLGAFGGAGGLIAAYFGVQLLVATFGTALPRSAEISPDLRVLAFTAVVAILAGLAAAAAPAWQLTRHDATEVLKRGGRGNSSAGDGRVRNALVVSEIALALMLLVGAGLLVRSLGALRSVDLGFDSRRLLALYVSASKAKYSTPQALVGFFDDVVERVGALPGVESAATVDTVPLVGGSTQPVLTEQNGALPLSELPPAAIRIASPGYFDTVRIPLSMGRAFERTDTAGGRLVAVVGESAAARLWPGENPIGKWLALPLIDNDHREVVGVVKDIKINDLDEKESEPAVYVPAAQIAAPYLAAFNGMGLTVIIRTSVEPETLSKPVIAKIREVNPEQLVSNVQTMDAIVERALGQRPFAMKLLAGFAGLALFLATIGIYSVITYSVTQRVREIGIRLALGAPSGSVLRLIVAEGMRPMLLGLGLGLALAAVLVRFLTSQLFAVSAYDPVTFASMGAVVVAVGVVATLIPAYRATRVDPMVTLRAE